MASKASYNYKWEPISESEKAAFGNWVDITADQGDSARRAAASMPHMVHRGSVPTKNASLNKLSEKIQKTFFGQSAAAMSPTCQF